MPLVAPLIIIIRKKGVFKVIKKKKGSIPNGLLKGFPGLRNSALLKI